jgi:hypothetical protein
MPRKGVKTLQKTADTAIIIRCRYCDIESTCSQRPIKEAYENAGWMTRCGITPNRLNKKKKKS